MGYKDFKHTVPTAGMGQKTYEQCWLASYQMLYTYHKLSAGSVEGKLSGGGIDVADAKANGLEDRKYGDAATALGLTTWSGEKFKKEASWYDMGLTDGCEAFLDELQTGPLWVSRYIRTGLYHIVIATGFTWGASDKGYIIFNNPYPGPTNAVESSDVPANVFVKHITSARGSVQAYRS